MIELFVLLCMRDSPDRCQTPMVRAFPSEQTCQAAGRDYLPAASGLKVHAWTCAPEGKGAAYWISEVAPGVFVHKGQQAEPGPENGADTTNIGYVIGQNAVAVIDAGGGDSVAQALLDEIRRRTDLPVKYLILTHMHPDHVLGAGVFAGAGAEIIGHPQLPAALAARHPHYLAAYRREVGPGWHGIDPFPPIVPAPDRLDLGGRVLELRQHATGHTNNDLTVFDRETATWFMGDLVFLDHMPSIDGSLRGWSGALDLAESRIATRTVPGHGPVSAPWPEAAMPTRTYLSDLVETVRAALDDGTGLLDAVTEIGGNPPPGWLLSHTFHPRNVTTAYRELEWE